MATDFDAQRFNPDQDEINRRLNPQRPLEEDLNSEEFFPKEEYDLQTLDIILMAIRCAVVVICMVGIVLIFVNLCRGLHIKSWRLYCLTSLTIFAWIGLTLYQDHFDRYYVHEIYRYGLILV